MSTVDYAPPDYDNAGISKTEFARRLGLSPGRVSQLIQAGMPVRDDGKIDEAEARSWYETNTDPSRRRGRAVVTDTPPGARLGGADAAPHSDTDMGYSAARAEHERLKAEERAMRLARERGETRSREEVETVIADLGRHHREVWSQFPAQVAPLLAAEFGVPEPALLHALEAHVRGRLAAMVETPPEGLRP